MQTLGKFPSVRMRRMRHDDFSRRLMRESRVSVDDLIYPVFVIEGNNKRVQVPSMPGVERLSLDLLLKQAEECVKLGIPVMALFPSIDASLKTPDGREAANPDGLIPRVVRSLKEHFPELGVMSRSTLTPLTVKTALSTRPASSLTTKPSKCSLNRCLLRHRPVQTSLHLPT